MRPASSAAESGRSTAGPLDLRRGVGLGEASVALMRAGGGEMLVRSEAGGVVAFRVPVGRTGLAPCSSKSDDIAYTYRSLIADTRTQTNDGESVRE